MEDSAGILVTEGNTAGHHDRWGGVRAALEAQVAEAWLFSRDRDEILHSERTIFVASEKDLVKELENRNPPPGPDFSLVIRGRNANLVLVLKHPLLEISPEDIIGGEMDHRIKRMEAMAAARAHGCICVPDRLRWGEEITTVSREEARDPWQNTEWSTLYLLNEGFVIDANADNLSSTKRLWCDSAKYNRILSARRTALKRRIAKEKIKAKGPVSRPSYVPVGMTKDRVFDFKDKLRKMWGRKCRLYNNHGYIYLWSWDGTSYGRNTKIGHIQEIGIILKQTRGILSRGAIRKMAGFRGFILDFHRGLDVLKDCDGSEYLKVFYKYVEEEYKRIPAKYKKTVKKKTKKRAKQSA